MLTEGSEVDPEMSAVIHLPGLTRGDSAGLALVVKWLAVAQASGGVLRYTWLPENFARLDFLDSHFEC